MKFCETCKSWEKPTSEFGEIPGSGICRRIPQYWDATQWTADGESRVLKERYAGNLAFVKDGSDYRAELKTLPKFGCVEHIEK
jgi:hypothetical protein